MRIPLQYIFVRILDIKIHLVEVTLQVVHVISVEKVYIIIFRILQYCTQQVQLYAKYLCSKHGSWLPVLRVAIAVRINIFLLNLSRDLKYQTSVIIDHLQCNCHGLLTVGQTNYKRKMAKVNNNYEYLVLNSTFLKHLQ